MPVVKLTARGWETLRAEAGKRTDYRDEELPGFYLRVAPSGARSFGVVYTAEGRLARLTLGNASVVSLADARDLARKTLASVVQGSDPAATKREARQQLAASSVEALAERFLTSREAEKWRPKTRQEFARLVGVEIVPAIGKLPPADVTRPVIRDMVERIADGVKKPGGGWKRKPAPYVANRVLSLTKLLWAWALDREHVQASPVMGLKPPSEEKPRDIEYTDEEIRSIFGVATKEAAEAPADRDTADVVALLFFTGARLNEVLGMEWGEIDSARAEWRIPPGRSKVGRKKPRSRVIPLTREALDVLSRRRSTKLVGITTGRFVFPAARGDGHLMRPTKHLTRLKADSRVRTFMPHGIRHTLRARLARLGVAPHVAEQILGHSLRGMEAQYIATGVEFVPEMRDALEKWAAMLRAILGPKTAQVRA